MNDRHSSSMRSWVPGLFATFWILLAAFSAAYLFRIVTEPHAGKETALAEPAMTQVQTPPPLSAEQASALISSNEAKDREIADLKTTLDTLSQQMTEMNTRLQPLEKVLGPVAALPSGGAVTTSPPSPDAEVLATPPPDPAKPAKLSKQEAAKEEAAKKEAAKKEEAAKQEAAKQEAAKQEAAKQEAAKQEAAKQEAAKQEAAKQEAAKQEAAKQEAAKQEAAKQEAAKQEAAKQEAAKQEAAKQEAAKQEAAKEGEKSAEPAPPSTQVASTDQNSGGTEMSSSSAPAPSDTSVDSANPAASAGTQTANVSGSAIPIPPGTTRFGIEIGGADKQDGLRPLWKDLISNHAALVAGLQAKRVLAPDKKWRLVAGPFANVEEATQACGLFKKANLPCEATVFAGDAF
jgi:hypothetical protein